MRLVLFETLSRPLWRHSNDNRIRVTSDDVLSIGTAEKRSDIYKRELFVAWQSQCHDRLSEIFGTLWIHGRVLTNRRCSAGAGLHFYNYYHIPKGNELTQYKSLQLIKSMMTSSNGNIFHVTGLLQGGPTGHWWIPPTKARDAELWCFLWCAPEQTVEQTVNMPVLWGAMALIVTSLLCIWKSITGQQGTQCVLVIFNITLINLIRNRRFLEVLSLAAFAILYRF